MYRYHLLLFPLWVISAAEDDSGKAKNLNHNPLILADKFGNYNYPKKAYITNEQTQEYYHSKTHDGRYYCPLENNEENDELIQDIKYYKVVEYEYCLFEKKFKKGEKMCQDEVKPLIVEKRDKHGHTICGNGFLYKFAYEICVKKSPFKKIWRLLRRKSRPKRDLFSDVHHLHLYDVCYNHSDHGDNPRAVLFTEHTIMYPYILRNLILKEERVMHDFSNRYSTESYGHKELANLWKILKAYELEMRINRNKFFPQMLVPMYDFALGHWMRTTLHIINYSPQDITLEPLWRAINVHTYNRLIKLYEKLGDVRIFTGTWGVLTNQNGEFYVGNDKDARVNVPLMWWKLLYATDVGQAVIIIMHNVANLEKICYEEENVCDVSKWELSDKLNEWHYNFVYCCKMSSVEDKIATIKQLRVKTLKNILKLD